MRPPRPPKDYDDHHPRRNLRPRRERSYAESPDIIVLSDEEPRINGFANGYESDSDDGEMPPLPPIKVFCLVFHKLTWYKLCHLAGIVKRGAS